MKKCAICSGEPQAFPRTGLHERAIEPDGLEFSQWRHTMQHPFRSFATICVAGRTLERPVIRSWNCSGAAVSFLLGEASHGTHEFIKLARRFTERLITEKGFSAVAVEADWPDAYRVNRYVAKAAGPKTPMRQKALKSF